MPDKPNAVEAEQVGQDKPIKDFVQKYDAEVGIYKEQAPSLSQSPAPQQPAPFKIGG